ncbi:hypothetical protein L9F63_001231, partial [Diploptera punctata]
LQYVSHNMLKPFERNPSALQPLVSRISHTSIQRSNRRRRFVLCIFSNKSIHAMSDLEDFDHVFEQENRRLILRVADVFLYADENNGSGFIAENSGDWNSLTGKR